MPSENKNIDQFFHRKVEETNADTSAMDQHWKQMQDLLSPVAPAAGATGKLARLISKKMILLIAAAAITGAVFFIIVSKNTGNTAPGKNEAATIAAVQPQVDDTSKRKMVLVIDTAKKTAVVTSISLVNDTGRRPVRIQLKAVNSNKDTVSIWAQTVTNQVALQQPFNKAVTLNTVAANTISGFYDQMQRPAQEFTIDAAKGGSIACTEGTVVTIPPAAFTDASGNMLSGAIKISVEEFYTYSDMIAANLTTVSNGQQLITGGMVKLTALQNNQEVQLRNDKAINLSMPAKKYDAAMQLFLADEKKVVNTITAGAGNNTATADTISTPVNAYSRILNWQLADMEGAMRFDGRTNFLNMEDEPVRVRETRKKRIGVFHITKELPMTEAEAKKILLEKYGTYYDVIKVKKVKPVQNILFSKLWYERQHIGDSTRLTVDQAVRWHYISSKDSLFYVNKIMADSIKFINNQRFVNSSYVVVNGPAYTIKDTAIMLKISDSLNQVYLQRQKVEQSYNFSIPKTGWINCDKFYRNENKADFVLNLPADVEANKFVTQIVFTGIRSVMPGRFYQNKIGFLNIPVDMPVYIVGLGERNGKVVSFIQSLKTSANDVSVNTLEETTPEAFKQKLKQLDL